MDMVFNFLVIVIIIVAKFIFTKLLTPRCNSKVCLVGKTALVTGGSQGIGYQIVLGLAQRGCKVILADRIISNDIKNKIMQETNNTEIYMEFVDLASFQSVRNLTKRLNTSEEKLDIVIHNAGMGHCEGELTEDGLNKTMQVNYYSPFLLTHLISDLMKNSANCRLIFCSSPIILKVASILIFGKNMAKTFEDYRLSKFCLLVAADIFAEKLKTHNITSNSFHPGGVNTTLHYQFFQNKFILWVSRTFGSIYFKSPEEGAQTAIYLACANEVQKVTGSFFADLIPIRKPKELENETMCETIWETSEKLTKLKKEELL